MATTSSEGASAAASAASSPITPPTTRRGAAASSERPPRRHRPRPPSPRRRRHRSRDPPRPIASAVTRVFAGLTILLLTGGGGISSEVVAPTRPTRTVATATTTMAFAGLGPGRGAGAAVWAGRAGASRWKGSPWNAVGGPVATATTAKGGGDAVGRERGSTGGALAASLSLLSNGARPSSSTPLLVATRTAFPQTSRLLPAAALSPSMLFSRLYAAGGGGGGDDRDSGDGGARRNTTSPPPIGGGGDNPYADVGRGNSHRENSYPDPDLQRLKRLNPTAADADGGDVNADAGAGRDDWDVVDSALFASASAGGVAAFGERGPGRNASIGAAGFLNDTATIPAASSVTDTGAINGDGVVSGESAPSTTASAVIPPADEIRTTAPPSPPSSPPNSTDDAGTAAGTSEDLPQPDASAADDALSIHPHSIEILPVALSAEEEQHKRDAASRFLKSSYGMYPFVNMFRGSAMYIARHRNTVMVYHISGELLEWDGFPNLVNDIALTWLLGTRVVIVIGCRCFVDRRLKELGRWPPERRGGVRVTDETVLRIVKEEAGFVRFEVERQLARAVRQGSYFASSSSDEKGQKNAGAGLPNVVSGNFYSAQPFGVVDGVDHQYTGILRRVEKDKIRQAHDANDIVLLTNLGVSPSGELFNVNSESLASGVAGALEANKIVFFALAGTELRDVETGKMIMSLRQSDAKKLLEYNGLTVRRGGYTVFDSDTEHHPAVIETLLKIGWSLHALQNGVKRAHIIPPVNGALLQELYTRDGAGTLVSRDIYEGIRRANVNDVAGIFDLIQPLVKMGTLAVRTRTTLEKDILSYFIYTRDNLIVACGQLHRFEGGYAEIGCLVVNRDYRSQGRGDAMLGYLERLCVQSGARNVFVLSTQTMQFFIERGFREVGVDNLPPSRRASYNHARRSKIYLKRITDDRDLDADELLWDR